MARLLSPIETSDPADAPRPQALVNRAALVAAVAAAGLAALALTLRFAPAPRMDADLLRLLHGMVLIKGLIGLAAAGLMFWRFGRPTAPRLAAGYVGALCVSAAALGWLWGLQSILAASALFYTGLAGLVLVGRHDPLLADARVPGGRHRAHPRPQLRVVPGGRAGPAAGSGTHDRKGHGDGPGEGQAVGE